MHKPYNGPINYKVMSRDVLQAYQSWADQNKRCNNKKNKRFKYYGGKGVKVMYSSKDFIGWWIYNLKKFKGNRPTVDRINSDGHYEFSNIQMLDVSDNSRKSVIITNKKLRGSK